MSLRPMLFAVALVAAAPACNTAREPSNADMKVDVQNADRVLTSAPWKLVSYVPEVPPEPMLAALLQVEIQTLVVRFENGRMKADGAGIHVDRAYRIEEAYGPRFKLVVVDEQGIATSSTCEISADDNWIAFTGETQPWRGVGTVHRIGS